MHEVNLSGLDLNLLPALEALLRRRNVTHAAQEVGLSQPAMSRALSRLRILLGDPLLVRGHHGLVLTPKAQALVPRLSVAVADLKELFRERRFDPATEQRTIRIAASDNQTVLLAPLLMARLAREAPGIDLRFEPYRADLRERMESGSLDFAFALATTDLPPGAVSMPIADDRLALVMRRGHPRANRIWRIGDYADVDHVGIALLDDGRSELDGILAAAGVSRRVALVTPHFIAALAAVAATDMVTTISLALARRFAGAFDLIVKPPPFAKVELPMTLVWSHLRNADPLLVWFRGLLREVAGPAYAERRQRAARRTT
ncbi:LysR family transcriptional regulator [Rhodopseudomonas sp. BR0M22]|uniref:LysR family transcriptional regulator n=1 Tax=Rhodopseudomonas sp. BR0M22 TaxID=2269369 RepID=UPI0013E08C16|nr:LysR family transcriptional regulator [Rhodopseudomonas sp. BR0M22]NEW92262.1 LysR family transcriptional regulator [Rhodopseudomonas sp. BR0M22]